MTTKIKVCNSRLLTQIVLYHVPSSFSEVIESMLIETKVFVKLNYSILSDHL